METHFLSQFVEGEPEFSKTPWYNPHGDCIVYQTADEEVVAERVDSILTFYRSAKDNRPIGFQIKGVRELIMRYGWDSLAFATELSEHGRQVESVSIGTLLFAAYEAGPMNVTRRQAYGRFVGAGLNVQMSKEDLVTA